MEASCSRGSRRAAPFLASISIVSDIRLPHCSGLSVLATVRRAQWALPVVLMTAFSDPETRRLVESLGAILFDKPFALDDLRTAVANLLPSS